MNQNKHIIHCKRCNKEILRYKSKKVVNYQFCTLKCAYEFRKEDSFQRELKIIPKINDKFIKWFVGFFEGEGSFTALVKTQKNNQYRSINISVYQNEKFVLQYIRNNFNFGKVYKQKARGISTQDGYKWRTDSRGACAVVAYFLKQLLISNHRKVQFKNWVKYANLKPYIKKLEELYGPYSS